MYTGNDFRLISAMKSTIMICVIEAALDIDIAMTVENS